MRLSAIAAVLTLTFAPGLALAECSWGKMDQHASVTCADGTTWDATSQACVDTMS
jgi:hypothetical protein